MSYELLLRNCRLLHPSQPIAQVDIAIDNGQIAAIAPRMPVLAQTELDLNGHLVSPPFVESHIHLDSAMTAGEPRWNQSGTLFEGIEIWRERKQDLTLEEVKKRAIATLKQQAMQGVLFVRSHADVSESNLVALQGLLAAREAVKELDDAASGGVSSRRYLWRRKK